jgi:anti-anti-sigma regulatory factor
MAVSTRVIRIDGDCLASSLAEAHQSLEAAETEVVLDFSSTPRLDVDAVKELEKLAGAADSHGTNVTVRGVNVDVYKVLKLTGLTRRFSFS